MLQIIYASQLIKLLGITSSIYTVMLGSQILLLSDSPETLLEMCKILVQ